MGAHTESQLSLDELLCKHSPLVQRREGSTMLAIVVHSSKFRLMKAQKEQFLYAVTCVRVSLADTHTLITVRHTRFCRIACSNG